MTRTIVILLGCPGAGKGTQAPIVGRLLGIPQISTGGILRDEIAAETNLGKTVQALIRSGGLASDDIVNRLVAQRIQKDDCASGFILDGYPRTIQQATWFQTELGDADRIVAVDIDVDIESLVLRLKSRLQCKCCNAVYNLRTAMPRIEGLCDHCGIGLTQRDDDREEVVRERFRTYRDHTWPLVEYFRGYGAYYRVDGMRPADEVSQTIIEILKMCGFRSMNPASGAQKVPVLSY